MRTAKTLIRLGGCPGCSESSLGVHAILLVLSCRGSHSENTQIIASQLFPASEEIAMLHVDKKTRRLAESSEERHNRDK